MCAVSMVIGDWTSERSPNYIPFTPVIPTPDTAAQMLEVIKRLDAIDKALGMLDCKVEKVAKQKFIKKLKRRSRQPVSPRSPP